PAGRVEVPAPPAEERPRPLTTRTLDDLLSVVGSALGAFAGTWVVYEQLLPLSGVLGFVICWFVAFLVMYASVCALSHPRPIVVSKLMTVVMTSAAVLVGLALATVIVYTVGKGVKALVHLNFFTRDMAGGGAPSPPPQGGRAPAVAGA